MGTAVRQTGCSRSDTVMKIEYIVDGSICDYSATGNRPESFAPIHPPIHALTRWQSQTCIAVDTLAIIGDTPENCQAVTDRSLTTFSVAETSVVGRE